MFCPYTVKHKYSKHIYSDADSNHCVKYFSEKQSSRGGSRPSSAHSSTIVDIERPKTSSGTNNKKTELTKSGQLKETILFG